MRCDASQCLSEEMWILSFRYWGTIKDLKGNLDHEKWIIGRMWTDQIEEHMKARDQPNVTESSLSEGLE